MAETTKSMAKLALVASGQNTLMNENYVSFLALYDAFREGSL
jgi:hypothetical protein